jgi:hypothetical protein
MTIGRNSWTWAFAALKFANDVWMLVLGAEDQDVFPFDSQKVTYLTNNNHKYCLELINPVSL